MNLFPHRNKTMKKILFWLTGILAILVIAVEIFARAVLGLGDPPLSLGDPEIDYLFAPNQDCKRFGNQIVYNAVSMRSTHMPSAKRGQEARRVLIIGDSVVNGGVMTDQKDLASELLDTWMREAKLGDAYNISAGSWGPMNYAAYLRRYGSFDATDIVLEVNCHDLWEDDPVDSAGRSVGIDVSLPAQKPLLACTEGFSRYFWPCVRALLGKAVVNNKIDVARWGDSVNAPAVKENLQAVDYIFSLPAKNKWLIVHRTQKEWQSGAVPLGEKEFCDRAKTHGAKVLLLQLDVPADYRDNIHLNPSGQRKLYELLKRSLFVEPSAEG